jgi:hypothetical protein
VCAQGDFSQLCCYPPHHLTGWWPNLRSLCVVVGSGPRALWFGGCCVSGPSYVLQRHARCVVGFVWSRLLLASDCCMVLPLLLRTAHMCGCVLCVGRGSSGGVPFSAVGKLSSCQRDGPFFLAVAAGYTCPLLQVLCAHIRAQSTAPSNHVPRTSFSPTPPGPQRCVLSSAAAGVDLLGRQSYCCAQCMHIAALLYPAWVSGHLSSGGRVLPGVVCVRWMLCGPAG